MADCDKLAVRRLKGEPPPCCCLEQNDEWLVGRRYLSLESMAFVLAAEHAHTTSLEVATLPAA